MLVPANCTDQLQPLDIAVNKPLKDVLKKQFHTWYAEEIQKQLKTDVPVHNVTVVVRAAVIKAKSAGWFIASWQSLQSRLEIVSTAFRRSGILHAVAGIELHTVSSCTYVILLYDT